MSGSALLLGALITPWVGAALISLCGRSPNLREAITLLCAVTLFGFVVALLVIVFPQALRMTVAPLTNRTIAIAKNTALGSVIAVPEILNIATSALNESANSTPLTMAALMYLMLFAPLVVCSRWLERRYPQRR